MEGVIASGTHSPQERMDHAALQTPEHEENMDSLLGLINKKKKN